MDTQSKVNIPHSLLLFLFYTLLFKFDTKTTFVGKKYLI